MSTDIDGERVGNILFDDLSLAFYGYWNGVRAWAIFTC